MLVFFFLGTGIKPVGYYVQRVGGLFPAPYPQNSKRLDFLCKMFKFLGIFLAKVLQDGRLVDLPLSRPFLKFMSSSNLTDAEQKDDDVNVAPTPIDERRRSSWNLDDCRRRRMTDDSFFLTIFDSDDFKSINPLKGRFLKQLENLAERRREILKRDDLNSEQKHRAIDELLLKIDDDHSCRLDDLSLTFQLNPSSQYYEYQHADLIKDGGSVEVTLDNIETYIDCCYDFYLNTGVRRQLEAFKNGFDLVFPMKKLQAFSPEEVQVKKRSYLFLNCCTVFVVFRRSLAAFNFPNGRATTSLILPNRNWVIRKKVQDFYVSSKYCAK